MCRVSLSISFKLLDEKILKINIGFLLANIKQI